MRRHLDPVVVHGHGRTGTTLLVRLLGLHPDLAWFSQYHGRWPGHPSVAAASRLADLEPVRNRYRSRRWFPQPAEAIQSWERCFPGFHDNRPDWGAADATPEAAARFQREVARTCAWQGKPGFLTKYTGHPRYGFVQAVLPGVRILHLDRDPRAVVMSVIKQRWGYKQRPAEWAALSPLDRIDLAADRYLLWTKEMAGHRAGDDHVSFRYEDLVADPQDTLARMLVALDLDRPAAFDRRLSTYQLRDAGEAWRNKVTAEELAHLEHRLGPALAARGYR